MGNCCESEAAGDAVLNAGEKGIARPMKKKEITHEMETLETKEPSSSAEKQQKQEQKYGLLLEDEEAAQEMKQREEAEAEAERQRLEQEKQDEINKKELADRIE